MSDFTQMLERARNGDAQAAEQLMPLVYEELRCLAAAKMAQETPGHTLQPTALVHEAWLRLGGDQQPNWENRAHFFGAAAEAMRRILIDLARRKKQVRHGGGKERVDLNTEIPDSRDCELILRVHEVLDELASSDPIKAQVVKLRYFVGLENAEIASLLNISERTVQRAWNFSKAWLFAAIRKQPGP